MTGRRFSARTYNSRQEFDFQRLLQDHAFFDMNMIFTSKYAGNKTKSKKKSKRIKHKHLEPKKKAR